MNINISNISNNQSAKKPYLNTSEASLKLPQNKIEVKDGVVTEFGEEGYMYITDRDIFELRNKEKSWHINGKNVAYKDMDEDTKNFLFELTGVHKKYSSEHSGRESQYTFSFKELTVQLGNKYAAMIEQVKNNSNGDVDKLDKLNAAFKMYVETKVVGNEQEVGSMAHRAHWKLNHARLERRMQETRAKVLQGEKYLNVKSRDITKDDKATIKELMKNALNVMNNVADYFQKGNGIIKTDEDMKKFNDYTKIGSGNSNWSLEKLSSTFKLLSDIDSTNEGRITKDKYNEFFENNEDFSENEKTIFDEIFRINNMIS